MSELPEPLTRTDCDLRDYPWMPLDVVRLRDSELAGLKNPEAFRCAMLLFCAAWHQVPAASLPDDDETLARLSGYGRDVKTFLSAKKAGALRGWVKCKDGRLYHAVQSEKANEAMAAKAAQKARTEAARRAKEAKRSAVTGGNGQSSQAKATDTVAKSDTERVTSSVTEPVTASRREDRTGQEIQREDSVLRTAAGAPSDGVRSILFSDGLAVMQRCTGKTASSSRALIGKLLRDAHDDCAMVLAVLREADGIDCADPVGWISAAVQARTGTRLTPFQARRAESDRKMRDWIARTGSPDNAPQDCQPPQLELVQ